MLLDHLQKTKKRKQKFKEARDSQYIYQNELGKACFQHDMVDGDFKYLSIKQLLIKYCMIKHLILLKILNLMDINTDLLQWYIIFLIKKLLVVVLKMKIWHTNVPWI